ERRPRIWLGGDGRVILRRAPDPVLRREQSHQTHAARVTQQRRGVLEPTIDGGLVREQADAATAERTETITKEDIETGQDGGHPSMVAQPVIPCAPWRARCVTSGSRPSGPIARRRGSIVSTRAASARG